MDTAGRRQVVVLGSTGTIGRLALEVIERLSDRFRLVGLAAWRNAGLLAEQTLRHRPDLVAIADPLAVESLRERVAGAWEGEILAGRGGIVQIARCDADLVVNALVGSAGLEPSLAALRAGRILALANKESLVVGGELVRAAIHEGKGRIVPIDSEHSALLQCLDGRSAASARRLILTASGGPFRTWPRERIERATADDAMKHPTWKMGARITVDSATLLNKGFEIHEARWLFDLPGERIDVWVHPQSVVHALVEWQDGSLIAQLSVADMRLPIQTALCHPERPPSGIPSCDLTSIEGLTFEQVDQDRYPCLALAREALATGGTAPAVLNAADEVLVEEFLVGRIRFPDIARHLRRLMDEHRFGPATDIDSVRDADRAARLRARALASVG
ncbi:MAG: 1-deoxy-D-xylulose-5-phosphate reductoisomerase [Candidatus Eisenbacteria bacterium]|nr:1-deoxy-D-xylulose-5-phosphate reductoisomerase [Candidatus Eisenbacteria bacterium]